MNKKYAIYQHQINAMVMHYLYECGAAKEFQENHENGDSIQLPGTRADIVDTGRFLWVVAKVHGSMKIVSFYDTQTQAVIDLRFYNNCATRTTLKYSREFLNWLIANHQRFHHFYHYVPIATD